MRAINKHNIGFEFGFILVVDLVDKLIDQGALPSTGRSVENQMGHCFGAVKIIQFLADGIVDG